jgi:predicted transcriptional regulator
MKISLSFKVNPRLKRALEKLAQKENRSLSNYVVTLLMRHLEEQDINWREEESQK